MTAANSEGANIERPTQAKLERGTLESPGARYGFIPNCQNKNE